MVLDISQLKCLLFDVSLCVIIKRVGGGGWVIWNISLHAIAVECLLYYNTASGFHKFILLYKWSGVVDCFLAINPTINIRKAEKSVSLQVVPLDLWCTQRKWLIVSCFFILTFMIYDSRSVFICYKRKSGWFDITSVTNGLT